MFGEGGMIGERMRELQGGDVWGGPGGMIGERMRGGELGKFMGEGRG